jgi:hypothetical protein
MLAGRDAGAFYGVYIAYPYGYDDHARAFITVTLWELDLMSSAQ